MLANPCCRSRGHSCPVPAEMSTIKRTSLYRHANLHVAATRRAIHKMSDAEKMQRRKIDTAKAVVVAISIPPSISVPRRSPKTSSGPRDGSTTPLTCLRDQAAFRPVDAVSGAHSRLRVRGKLVAASRTALR